MPRLMTQGLGGPRRLLFTQGYRGPAVAFADFWSAVQARLVAQVPALVGGVWAYRAGGGRVLPYADYDDGAGSDETFDSSAAAVGDGTFTVSVYADDKPEADRLARLVRSALNDAPLAFADGTLLMLRSKGRHRGSEDPDEGPDGQVVYQSIVTFRYLLDE